MVVEEEEASDPDPDPEKEEHASDRDPSTTYLVGAPCRRPHLRWNVGVESQR